MDFLSWLQIVIICALGAMSPGPSLAIVLRNTIKGGKKQGVLTGIGHGLGICIYAGLVVAGLTIVLVTNPQLKAVINYAGAILLVWLGLSERAKHRPARLSGGEQQRVAIGRAIATSPKLLLADEPTGNLDPATADEVFSLLIKLVSGAGMAALIATHNPEIAARMDRILKLDQGKLLVA